MKRFITIISVLIIGIARSGPPLIQDLVIPRYPLKVGNTWEYHRTFYTIVYDTVGNNIGYCVSDDILELTNLNVSIGIKNQTFHTPMIDYSVQPAGSPPGSRIVFRYTLTSPAYVVLAIYTSRGRLIKRLVSERQSSGIHTIFWDNRDSAGHKTSSHLYLGCLKTDNALTVNKLVVLQ